ncbi:MAG: G5 domain-containing protein [Clostridia bacterium]|nr:G5 domain-containing protein [Clostridia bacterium]
MIEFLKAYLAASPVRKTSKRRILAIVSALVIICSIVTLTAFAAAATYKVTIEEDGVEPITVSTREDTIEEFLKKNSKKYTLGKYDYLDTSEFVAGEDCTLTIYRAQTIKVVDEGEIHHLKGAGPAKQMLEKHGIVLGKFDEVNIPDDVMVSSDKTVEISRSFGVTILADGKEVDVEIASGTVTDALKRANIVLDEDDETIPTAESTLVSEMTIEVLRVEYKERVATEVIPFETITRRTPDLYVGQTKVKVKGSDGEKEVTYKDKYVNGELDSSEVLDEKILKEMVTKVVLKGRVPRVNTIKFKNGLSPISELKVPSKVKLDANGLPTSYKKIVDGTAKSYYGGGTTASGRKAMPGHIAVNPKQFPYGTELYIVSLDGKFIYGYCIAADTGGFVKTNSCTVDLYMNTIEECYAWGHRGVRIYVL